MLLDDYVCLNQEQITKKIEFLKKRIKENKRSYNKMFSCFKTTGNLQCVNQMNHLSNTNYQIEEEIKYLTLLSSVYG